MGEELLIQKQEGHQYAFWDGITGDIFRMIDAIKKGKFLRKTVVNFDMSYTDFTSSLATGQILCHEAERHINHIS